MELGSLPEWFTACAEVLAVCTALFLPQYRAYRDLSLIHIYAANPSASARGSASKSRWQCISNRRYLMRARSPPTCGSPRRRSSGP